MILHWTTGCHTVLLKKTGPVIYSFLTMIFFIATFFSGKPGIAQTFPTSCTSKDLTLLKADLPAPANDRCNCSGSRVLILGIRNGTNSFRTSFALWGTLIRKDASGNETRQSIFACANGIKGKNEVPNGDNFLPASTIEINGAPVSTNQLGQPVIQVNCGESLDIIDMHLAWTSSNSNETCDVLKNNPFTINPKCGVQDLIHVGVGVDAAIVPTSATCVSGGKLKVAPSGGFSPYEVSLDGGNYLAVPTNTGNYEFTNVSGGQHTVIIRDNTSRPVIERCSTSKTPTVGSTAAPTASISANRTTITCTNPSATLTASGGVSYSWSPGGATTAEITVRPTNTTIYTVTVTDANGCTDTENQAITVEKALPIAGISANRATVNCTNITATLTASGGGSYSWSPGGATTAEITISPTITNTYTVTVTGANGCTDTESQAIIVEKTLPTAGISANRTTVNCTNTTATLTANGGVGYLWSPGGATAAEITVSPTNTTTYTVTVTGANGCTDTESQAITVDQQLPSFTVCIVQPTLCVQYGSVSFSASNGSGFTYSINNGSTFEESATFNSLLSGSVSGFKVKGSNGCVAALTCANATSTCSEVLGVGSNSVANQEIKLNGTSKTRVLAAPNPYNDHILFTLKSSVSGQGALELYNMLGQKVKTIFQGYVQANQAQAIEYAVPGEQRVNLIYLFRVGAEKTSGKLIGLKQ